MASIVRLAEYRRRRKPPRRAAPEPSRESRYYCTRCDADEFRVSAAGMIHCAHCGAWIRNLLVSVTPSREEGR